MVQAILISGHGVCGLAAFALGCMNLHPPMQRRPVLFYSYFGCLMLMIVFLISAVVLDWQTQPLPLHLVFSGLALLALYAGWRGVHAAQMTQASQGEQYIDDVGFTLITLFTGFVVVLVFDLGSPLWLVVTIGIVSVLGGRLGITTVKKKVSKSSVAV